MADIYTHSLCNLSALAAPHSAHGMFFSRKASDIAPTVIISKCGDDPTHSDRILYVSDRGFWDNQINAVILVTRAWVQQERLLPSRILHFGKEQLFWECRELHACEIFHHGVGPKQLSQSVFPNLPALAKEAIEGTALELLSERQNLIPTTRQALIPLDPLESL